jgi:ketosteroid isomerase-like protein
MRPPFFSVIVSLVSLVLIFRAPILSADTSLVASDRVAIQEVLEHFRTGWLSGEAKAVQNTFTEVAVLMPHHGVPPVVGMIAIKEFWWPASSAKTTITRFTQTLDEIGGEGHIAFVRGRSEVSWTIEDEKGVEKWRTGGNFLALLRKQPNGKWRISHLIWDDPPNQRLN